MKTILNNTVAVFVIMIVLMLLIPLGPFLLDFFFIINITLSIIILLITMNIKEALEFSIFPTLLLVTTLFRMALSISSTKLILTEAGKAGQVIETIGNFVLQGNIVVGVITFIIIVLVQFIVITKGAERVAEVSARFTLDAMPGKQMAIDADLSSGLINEEQARTRRRKIEREADMYGAMDGATKFVKGDAVLSIIITLVNFLAGVVIGMVVEQLPIGEVLGIYSIATVGDGLVSQIPSLIISTATAMIVTRAASEGSFNADVTKQFLNQPNTLVIAGGIIGLIAFLPDSPRVQIIITSGILITIGIMSGRRLRTAAETVEAPPEETEERLEAEAYDEGKFFRDVNNIYSLLTVEPIEISIGYSLIPLADERYGASLLDRLVIFRRQYAQETGFVLPAVQTTDSATLNANQYVIKIKGEEVACGEVLMDYYLALEPTDPAGVVDGIDTIEPAYGIPSKWITADRRDLAEIYGYTVIDPLSVIITHFSEVIKRNVAELLTRAEVMQLVENVKKNSPDLVNELIPGVVSIGVLQKILSMLLREGVSIKDLNTIFETIIDAAAVTKDVDPIVAQIRIALKRTITRKFCEEGQLRVITLDTEVERALVAGISRGEGGVFISAGPELIQKLVTQLTAERGKFDKLGSKFVVLTSDVIRLYVFRLLEQFFPDVTVLAFNEIAGNIQIQAVGNIVA